MEVAVRLNDDAYVLTLPFVLDGRSFPLNLTVITDAANGTTLVDTGLPGQRDAIAGGLAEAGLRLEDLSRIVLTHHDIDHVGSLHDLKQASGARVLAHEVERRSSTAARSLDSPGPRSWSDGPRCGPWPSAFSRPRSTRCCRTAAASTSRAGCG